MAYCSRYFLSTVIFCLALTHSIPAQDAYSPAQDAYFVYDELLKSLVNGNNVASDDILNGAWLNYRAKYFDNSIELLSHLRLKQGHEQPQYFFELSAVAHAQRGDWATAKEYWSSSLQELPMPSYEDHINNIDKSGLYIAYFLPGGGLIYEKQYVKGTISFIINSLLLYGIYNSWQTEKYGLSFFFLFLEIPFYKGNINATREQILTRSNNEFAEKKTTWIKEVESLISLHFEY